MTGLVFHVIVWILVTCGGVLLTFLLAHSLLEKYHEFMSVAPLNVTASIHYDVMIGYFAIVPELHPAAMRRITERFDDDRRYLSIQLIAKKPQRLYLWQFGHEIGGFSIDSLNVGGYVNIRWSGCSVAHAK